MPDENRLEALSQAGVSVWLDDLSRERLRDGHLRQSPSWSRPAW
jgi:hypothetical protein